MTRKAEPLLFFSFFMSGLTALIYQVSWLRLAGQYFEGMAWTAATVVAILMGGLALGSYLAGHLARRSRDLGLLYFNVQALIGLLALAVPWLMAAARPLFGSIYRDLYGQIIIYHLVRIVLTAGIMLPVAVLTGLTLPVLVQAITQEYSHLSRKAGLLYGVNAGGAAVGAALTGFVLLPQYGTLRTILVGVVINLLIAILGWTALKKFPWSRRSRPEPVGPVETEPLPTRRLILVAFTISGCCALCYEIIWTRLLAATLGPASSSFAAILCCFILGLAVGSALYAALSPRIKTSVLACGILLVLTAMAATATTLLLPRLPTTAARLIAGSSRYYEAVVVVKYLVAGMIIMPMAVCSGALLPASAAAYVPDANRLSERVGRLYAGNSIGAIVGALGAGFVLLPLLGANRAVLPVIGLQFAMGIYVVARYRGFRLATCLLTIAVAAVLAVALLPGVNPRLLFGGSLVDTSRYQNVTEHETAAARRRLFYYKDGPDATVTVMETPDRTRTFLAVNGQVEGSTDREGMVTQTMLAHLPLLLHPDPQDVLVIGLGTGITFAATLRYPVAKSVCIEISPEVVGASAIFTSFLEGMSLEDERAEIRVGDGRSYLFFSPNRFDVIIAQPSDVWVRGMGNLFSQEYFRAMRERLNAGGVACQWLQGYGLSPRTFKSILRTYSSVFPHVSLWWPNITGGDFLLLGSEEAYRFSVERLDSCITEYGVRCYDKPEDDYMTPYTLLRRFVAADEVLRDFAADAPLVTDDSGFLEYAATRDSYTSYLDVLHMELSRISDLPTEMVAPEDSALQDVAQRLAFYDYNRDRFIEFIYTDPSPEPWASPILTENEANWARDDDISPVLGRSLISFAERMYAESPYAPGTEEQAGLAYRVFQGYMEAFKFTPPTELDFANVAQLYRDIGDLEGSLETANEALRRGLRSAAVYQIKGEVLYAIASRHLAAAQEAGLASGEERASRMAEARRRLQEAFEAFSHAAETEPANPGHWLNMGVVQRLLGDSAAAREYWQKALEVDPGNKTALQFLNAPSR